MTQYEITLDEMRKFYRNEWRKLNPINSLIEHYGFFEELYIERDTKHETFTMLYQDDEAANVLRIVIDNKTRDISFGIVNGFISIFEFTKIQELCKCLDCFMEGMKC